MEEFKEEKPNEFRERLLLEDSHRTAKAIIDNIYLSIRSSIVEMRANKNTSNSQQAEANAVPMSTDIIERMLHEAGIEGVRVPKNLELSTYRMILESEGTESFGKYIMLLNQLDAQTQNGNLPLVNNGDDILNSPIKLNRYQITAISIDKRPEVYLNTFLKRELFRAIDYLRHDYDKHLDFLKRLKKEYQIKARLEGVESEKLTKIFFTNFDELIEDYINMNISDWMKQQMYLLEKVRYEVIAIAVMTVIGLCSIVWVENNYFQIHSSVSHEEVQLNSLALELSHYGITADYELKDGKYYIKIIKLGKKSQIEVARMIQDLSFKGELIIPRENLRSEYYSGTLEEYITNAVNAGEEPSIIFKPAE